MEHSAAERQVGTLAECFFGNIWRPDSSVTCSPKYLSSFWYFIVTANCLLLGAHVLIVMGALQIYNDDDDDDDDPCSDFIISTTAIKPFTYLTVIHL